MTASNLAAQMDETAVNVEPAGELRLAQEIIAHELRLRAANEEPLGPRQRARRRMGRVQGGFRMREQGFAPFRVR